MAVNLSEKSLSAYPDRTAESGDFPPKRRPPSARAGADGPLGSQRLPIDLRPVRRCCLIGLFYNLRAADIHAERTFS